MKLEKGFTDKTETKMKRKLIIIGSAVIAVLVTVTAFSQDPNRREIREKVRSYAKENILPVVAEERANFDNELSATEKQKVVELRERMLALKEEGKAFREQHGKGRGMKRGFHEKPDLTEEQKEQMYQHRKEMRLVRTEAFEIIDAHEDFFKSLRSTMEPKMDVWKEEIKSIVGDDMERMHEGGHGKGHGHHGRRGHGPGKMARELHSPVRFLLMDPNNPDLPGGDFEETKAYPNPSKGNQTLELKLKKAGAVNIDLYDNKGNFVRNLFSGELSKGDQKLNLELGNLSGKQYLYKITTPSGTDTKRVIVE